MPNSPHSPNHSTEVREYLGRLLPDVVLTDVPVNANFHPLLLMRTPHGLAAFAFANGVAEENYAALYAGFKKHYSAQSGNWDGLDLSFVFCVQPQIPGFDQLCSSIETDVYFCRKYVLPLQTPMSRALARLPFLPLAPLQGSPLRTPSAQTMLRQRGVPAALARYLAVPHQRAPEGILEECVRGEFGEPRLIPDAQEAAPIQPRRDVEPVRLERLEIKNFRAYRRPQAFELGADVTILYGPNGFGKTSFFDSIDFAVTGGIGRFDSDHGTGFEKTARHLDAGAEDGVVSLTFRNHRGVRRVTRSIRDRNQACINDIPADRKNILAELTGSDAPGADRVDRLVSLFRASHLFSQERQELTKQIQVHSQLPAEIVARMLAVEDYAQAVLKSTKVLEVAQRIVATAAEEIASLQEQISADGRELERLGQTGESHASIDSLDSGLHALRAKLEAVGVDVSPESPDIAMVRGWRATLESLHSESRAVGERLADLVREVASLPRVRADLAQVQQEIAKEEVLLKRVEDQRSAKEIMIRQADQRRAKATAEWEEAKIRSGLLEWVRTSKQVDARLRTRRRDLAAELTLAVESLARLTAAGELADKDLLARMESSTQVAQELQARQAELQGIQSLLAIFPKWEASRTRLSAVLQIERELLVDLETLRNEGHGLVTQHGTTLDEMQRLTQQVAEAEHNQSEFRTLISKLREHVETGTCPLCGEDHGSKDHLLERIAGHVAVDSASSTRASLAGVRIRAKQLSELVAANTQSQRAAEGQLERLKTERKTLESVVAENAKLASAVGVSISDSGTPPIDHVQALAVSLDQEVGRLGLLGNDLEASVEAARLAVAETDRAVASKGLEIEEKTAALSRLDEDIINLNSDPRSAQIQLDVEPAKLSELERLNLLRVEECKAEMAAAEAEASQRGPELAVIQHQIATHKAQMVELNKRASGYQAHIAKVAGRIQESQLPENVDETSMLALIGEQSSRQAQFLALRDSTSSFELAMDAATTAAALTTLRQAVRDRERAAVQAEERRTQHRPWLKYFEEVSRLVSSQQNSAIENFTREYGPRTSVIQRRLRAVYGFDEIGISSHESTIDVRVRRHEEQLRPADFFSQSQQQTLALALFLTACISQTWSAFSPVFLDDPVTHFDDLNTYAFLDLLLGFLESDADKRQFVISTCDEKMFLLARQKFRHLGDRAKFYRFLSIGSDGPSVEEVGAELN